VNARDVFVELFDQLPGALQIAVHLTRDAGQAVDQLRPEGVVYLPFIPNGVDDLAAASVGVGAVEAAAFRLRHRVRIPASWGAVRDPGHPVEETEDFSAA